MGYPRDRVGEEFDRWYGVVEGFVGILEREAKRRR